MFDANRLSQIDTLWTVVRQAHHGERMLAAPAQQQLLEIYGGAAQRYLRALVKNEHAADDLYQQFAVKFLQGDFAAATPERGRFRGLLKTALFRMAMDYHRQRQRRPPPQALDTNLQPADHDDERLADEQFVVSWRDELLSRTWLALEREDANRGAMMYSALRLRVDEPHLQSGELASKLSHSLGREITAPNLRVILHRAREKFAELLVDAVVQSLDRPTLAELEEELCELRLLEYCRPALPVRKSN